MAHFVYILQSQDGRYYTGYTTDLDRRFKEHQTGSGGKFTRSFGVETILYHEAYDSKSEALKREAQIKGLSRSKKEALIEMLADHFFVPKSTVSILKGTKGRKKMIQILVLLVAVVAGLSACGPRLSTDQYVAVMSELGCRGTLENTPEGEALMKAKGVTSTDVAEFRKKVDREVILKAATEIAQKVAACHGVTAP